MKEGVIRIVRVIRVISQHGGSWRPMASAMPCMKALAVCKQCCRCLAACRPVRGLCPDRQLASVVSVPQHERAPYRLWAYPGATRSMQRIQPS